MNHGACRNGVSRPTFHLLFLFFFFSPIRTLPLGIETSIQQSPCSAPVFPPFPSFLFFSVSGSGSGPRLCQERGEAPNGLFFLFFFFFFFFVFFVFFFFFLLFVGILPFFPSPPPFFFGKRRGCDLATERRKKGREICSLPSFFFSPFPFPPL